MAVCVFCCIFALEFFFSCFVRFRTHLAEDLAPGGAGLFFCRFLNILRLKSLQKHQKMQKNEKKCKKMQKKFAHIKKKYYLCTGFEKETKKRNQKQPQKMQQ